MVGEREEEIQRRIASARACASELEGLSARLHEVEGAGRPVGLEDVDAAVARRVGELEEEAAALEVELNEEAGGDALIL